MRPKAATQLRAEVSGLLQHGRIGDALLSIEREVDRVCCEPINTAVLFADAELDAACQSAGAACLKTLAILPQQAGAGDVVVFLASRLQVSGGHTALLADIAREQTGRCVILLTGISGPTDLPRVRRRFAGSGVTFERAPRGCRERKLRWLMQRLSVLAPTDVWLFNHHEDSVAIAAAQPGKTWRWHYVHHGDHHLCLGVTLSHVAHWDPHPMGYSHCRHQLGHASNRYLPMTAPDPAQAGATTLSNGDRLITTCTAGRSNKLEHGYWPSYADMIPVVLEATGGRHIHIGRLGSRYLRQIRAGMRRHKIPDDRFLYVPWVPNVGQAMQEHGVDVHLVSFPYAGAKTMIEAMAAGVPAVAHRHVSRPFLSALEMLPEGSAVWSTPGELASLLRALSKPQARIRGQHARLHYLGHHRPELFRAALAGQHIQPSGVSVGSPSKKDELAAALDVMSEISFKLLLRRRLRYWFRRARSWLS